MNSNQVKIILKKEFKETIHDKSYFISLIVNLMVIIFLLILFFYIIHSGSNDSKILYVYIASIVMPSFSALIMSLPLIQEKFWNDKLTLGLENMLTIPITLKKIWFGKLLSIFALTYLYTIFLSITLIISYNIFFGGKFSLNSLILTIILLPFMTTVFNLVYSYLTLKFRSPHIISIMSYIGAGLCLLTFFIMEYLFNHINIQTNLSMILFIVLIVLLLITYIIEDFF
jgi:hypothetical protein